MSKYLERYRRMEQELLGLRRRTAPGSEDEEDIFERLDEAYTGMSQEERDLVDSEGSTCWPNDHRTPFPGAEVGVNLFWVDGIDRYVWIDTQSAPSRRFGVHFMVNAGRRYADKELLPVPSAVDLARAFMDRYSLMLDTKRYGCFVTQYVWMLFWPPELTVGDLLRHVKTDPYFFESAGLSDGVGT